MKRKMALVSLILAVCLAIPFGGCADRSSETHIDETKTQLYVYNYDGGIGTAWLNAAAEKFTAKYADVNFEAGTSKKGVQIIIAQGKDNVDDIQDSPYNVFFTEEIYYNDFISKGQLLDISDMVREPLSEITEGKETESIEDKLDDSQKAAFTALDGKYYFLPHYESYSGLTYDRKVFSDNELYFKEGGGWTKVDAEKTVGPDGIRGNYDDGLPSSLEEFETLLKQMTRYGVAPFLWTGAHADYINYFIVGLWASLAGKEEFETAFNFNFKADEPVKSDIVTGFDSSGNPQIEEIAIKADNGYLSRQQASQYYALEFMRKIMTNSSYRSDKISGAMSHIDTQREYIYSDLENNPIAFLIEGAYWYNEAEQAFKSSVNAYKSKAENRDFAWMPLPRQLSGSVTEGNGTKNVLVDAISSFSFINANISDKPYLVDLAKLFLQYMYTDELMTDFTLSTGVPKGLEYEIEDTSKLNKYYKSIYDLRQVSDIARTYSAHPIFVNSQSSFFILGPAPYWSSTVNGTPYRTAYAAFDADVSAQDYFKGMWISPTVWESSYGQYFGV